MSDPFPYGFGGSDFDDSPKAEVRPLRPRDTMIQLTEFQHTSLCDVARSATGFYLLVRPNRIMDAPKQFELFTDNNNATDELLAMGLLSDVSDEFAEQVKEAAQLHGRVFRVLKITDQGRAMFNDSNSSTPVI